MADRSAGLVAKGSDIGAEVPATMTVVQRCLPLLPCVGRVVIPAVRQQVRPSGVSVGRQPVDGVRFR